jgi:hypothetical protein
MSVEHAKREILTSKNAASSRRTHSRESSNKYKEESSSSIKSHRRGDKKKKMKKVVYYETDSLSPSTSSFKSSSTSKRHERKKYSKMPLRYPHISKCAPLLSVALGKPPYFDGEDYCMWSDKMRHHLSSLHGSIWDIVEFGAQTPKVGDKDYDSDEAAQIRHFNSQTTSILLASLCREDYNKVQGLKSAKEIWDVLKTNQFLGRSLVSWASKKQNSIALSTAEAEYIATDHCCAQLLWIRKTLRDYGYKLSKVPLMCYNESAIRMTDNPVKHSRTKHIDIRYHFLRDHQQKGDIEIAYVNTHNQLAGIFTKPLDEKTFSKLRNEINILDSQNFH